MRGREREGNPISSEERTALPPWKPEDIRAFSEGDIKSTLRHQIVCSPLINEINSVIYKIVKLPGLSGGLQGPVQSSLTSDPSGIQSERAVLDRMSIHRFLLKATKKPCTRWDGAWRSSLSYALREHNFLFIFCCGNGFPLFWLLCRMSGCDTMNYK